MNAPLRVRLAALAARRTVSLVVALWAVFVLAVAIATRPDHAPHFGFARQHVFAAFLLAVAPLIVLHAARKSSPLHSNDSAWLATRSASNAAIAISTWSGAFGAWCLAAITFAIASDCGAPRGEHLLVGCGKSSLPAFQWFSTESPLEWRAQLPLDVQARSASFQIGLDAGSASEVRARSRGVAHGQETKASLMLGGRGTFEMPLPSDEHEVEFVLGCAGAGTRALVLSSEASLWADAPWRFSTSVNVALRLVLAGAVWLALALLLACHVGAATAACGVLALWVPTWMSDWPATTTRWIPAADLFDALEIVGTGRAPQPPTVHAWVGALAVVGFALAATALSLRRWRVSR